MTDKPCTRCGQKTIVVRLGGDRRWHEPFDAINPSADDGCTRDTLGDTSLTQEETDDLTGRLTGESNESPLPEAGETVSAGGVERALVALDFFGFHIREKHPACAEEAGEIVRAQLARIPALEAESERLKEPFWWCVDCNKEINPQVEGVLCTLIEITRFPKEPIE